MQFLKADTGVKVIVGPCVAVGDGFTPVTTLALTTADEAEIMKHDAAAVTSISANTFAAIASADGYYNLTLTAGQLDTEGMLTVLINDDSLCLPLRHDFMVVNANVYDSLYAPATTAFLQVDVKRLSGSTQSADDLQDFADEGYDPATNKVQGVVLTDTTTAVTNGVSLAAGAVTNASLAGNMEIVFETDFATNYNQTTRAWVTNYTDTLGTDPVTSYDPPTKTEMDSAFTEIKGATWSSLTDTLEDIRDKQTDIEADTNELQTDDVPGLIAALDAVVDTVKAETALIVEDTNELQTDDYPTSIAALQTDLDTLTDARGEPGQGAPAVSATTNTKIDYIYKAWRNQAEQTATTYSLYNDAATVVDQKATVSDDGTTATKGEVVTGP